uniref:DNA primase large subunit n=1 Tax=Timema douglasi TaxID=61478 RepID=A0A7R8ZBK6_TIMDO|nr:unnamed protein product [Timema douglasi]
MDLTLRRKVKKAVSGSLAELYPHDLQLYVLPPTCSISLAEFEEFAMERLKVLRIIDQINMKGLSKYSDDWRNAVLAELKKNGLKLYAKLVQGSGTGQTEFELQMRKRDHISHFILRLAYCRSEELRRWLLAKELDLFRLRFHALSAEGVRLFLQGNKLDYDPIPAEEKSRLRDCLYESTYMLSSVQIETYEFYRVPFLDVLDLVRARKCFLSSGYAYIPSVDFISVLSSKFRDNLSHALVMTARQLPALEEDERLFLMLKGLHNTYTGDDYSINKNTTGVRPEELDSGQILILQPPLCFQLSRKSFPLCMRQLHEHIRAHHHLKHGGRQQYGLFLKGIGVSLEDALRFWREEFTKLMDLDKFEKQYAYNIRHNYGKEGKRTNYTPYSCMKIIMGSVGPGDTHGCPFKHTDLPVLKQQLYNYNLPTADIQAVADLVSHGHYQVACMKYFEVTHKVVPDSITHPNQYFVQSQKALAGKEGFKMDTGKWSTDEAFLIRTCVEFMECLFMCPRSAAFGLAAPLPLVCESSSLPSAPTQKDKMDDSDMWGDDFDVSALSTSAINAVNSHTEK